MMSLIRLVIHLIADLLSSQQPPWRQAKRIVLQSIGIKINPSAYIDSGFRSRGMRNISIGAETLIGENCRIQAIGPVEIADGCQCATDLLIISGTHDTTTLAPTNGNVSIGRNCWIGARVTIVGTVNIGEASIIGAGSVVLSDIPANCIAVGTPCRVVRQRNQTRDNDIRTAQ